MPIFWLILAQIALVVLKVTGTIAVAWWLVLLPFICYSIWIAFCLLIAIGALIAVVLYAGGRGK